MRRWLRIMNKIFLRIYHTDFAPLGLSSLELERNGEFKKLRWSVNSNENTLFRAISSISSPDSCDAFSKQFNRLTSTATGAENFLDRHVSLGSWIRVYKFTGHDKSCRFSVRFNVNKMTHGDEDMAKDDEFWQSTAWRYRGQRRKEGIGNEARNEYQPFLFFGKRARSSWKWRGSNVKSCRVGNIRNNPCLVERRERVDIIRKKCKNLRTIERNCCNARNNISCRDCFYRISYHLRIYGYYGNGCLAQKVLSRKLNWSIQNISIIFSRVFEYGAFRLKNITNTYISIYVLFWSFLFLSLCMYTYIYVLYFYTFIDTRFYPP